MGLTELIIKLKELEEIYGNVVIKIDVSNRDSWSRLFDDISDLEVMETDDSRIVIINGN